MRVHNSCGGLGGPPATPIQPQAKPDCAARHTAQAKELNHRLAPPNESCFGVHGRSTFDFNLSLRLNLEE